MNCLKVERTHFVSFYGAVQVLPLPVSSIVFLVAKGLENLENEAIKHLMSLVMSAFNVLPHCQIKMKSSK